MAAYRRSVNSIAQISICLILIAQSISAQDILRQSAQQQQQQQQQNQAFHESQLANIQLPPQLAQLTPQQLHQLAQIRELQIQQQQRQAAAREANQNLQSGAAFNPSLGAPMPLGLEQNVPLNDVRMPTTASSTVNQAQQPALQATSAQPSTNNNDGSYNEADSELEGVEQPTSNSNNLSGNTQSSNAPQSQASPTSTQSSVSSGTATQPTAPPSFEVNWNKCPQLDPSDSEKAKKTQVITKCLQMAPIPQNLTRENVENHREQIATCALKVEGWFDDSGNYKYDKAENEIKSKKLETSIEVQVLKFHVACKEEANKKFPRPQEKLIDQVQFYQACMDYYISIVCEIEVSVDQ